MYPIFADIHVILVSYVTLLSLSNNTNSSTTCNLASEIILKLYGCSKRGHESF